MPRTKRPAKKPEKISENSEAVSKFEKAVAGYMVELDNRMDMEHGNLDMEYKILLGSIKQEYLTMTIGQLKSELIFKEVINTRSASQDDGYNTEVERSSQDSETHLKKPAPPSSRTASASASRTASASASRTVSVSRSRRSRSADASRGSARKLPAGRSHSHARPPNGPVYRTPAYNKNAAHAYPTITPKVAPHSALALLRQPRDGETVVSLTGSPVMVQTFNNMQQDEKAKCLIRLADGTMLALQPKQLRESLDLIPFSLMDDQTIHQLKTLGTNLQMIFQMSNCKQTNSK